MNIENLNYIISEVKGIYENTYVTYYTMSYSLIVFNLKYLKLFIKE